jgi:hypothetical protein
VIEREAGRPPEGNDLHGGGVGGGAEFTANRAERIGDGDRVPARVPPRVPVDAYEAVHPRLESRLLPHLATYGVLQVLAELDEAAGERVLPPVRLLAALHEDELPSMEDHRVHRHAGHVPPRHGLTPGTAS